MENLIIIGEHGEFFCPTINFNAETGICEIAGESYLEETFEFYKQVVGWLKKYIQEKKAPVFLQMKVTYFNTASSRVFIEIFEMLKEYKNEGGMANITWHYHDWDYDMVSEIEDFIVGAGVDIQMITFE